jgi:hypothetical protein
MLQGPLAMEQQQQQHIVKVAVRQGGQQQQQQQCLFRTPAPSSFVEQKLEQMYGPGMLCDEASVVLSPTEELQPGIAYFYNVCAGACAVAVCGPSCVKHTTGSPPPPAHSANCAQQQPCAAAQCNSSCGPYANAGGCLPWLLSCPCMHAAAHASCSCMHAATRVPVSCMCALEHHVHQHSAFQGTTRGSSMHAPVNTIEDCQLL